MGSLVEALGDVAKPFLPGGVPDVERYLAALQFDAFDFEVNSDGAEVVRLEGVLAVSHQQARLAHPAVPHHQVLQGDILLVHYLIITLPFKSRATPGAHSPARRLPFRRGGAIGGKGSE